MAGEQDTMTVELDNGTGGTPNHPAFKPGSTMSLDQVIRGKVNGQTVEYTVKDLLEKAQSVDSAGQRWQEAANIRKQAEKALSLNEDVKLLLEEGDVDALRRLGAAWGVPGDQVENIAQDIYDELIEDGGEGEEEEEVVQTNRNSRQGKDLGGDQMEQIMKAIETLAKEVRAPIDVSRLTPDMKRIVVGSESQRIQKIIENALDKSDQLRYYIKTAPTESSQVVRDLIMEKVRGRLPQYGNDFGDGSAILKDVLPEVEGIVKKLSPQGPTPSLGLGPSPSGNLVDTHPTKKPDHIPSTDDGRFEQHIIDTIVYNAGQLNEQVK